MKVLASRPTPPAVGLAVVRPRLWATSPCVLDTEANGGRNGRHRRPRLAPGRVRTGSTINRVRGQEFDPRPDKLTPPRMGRPDRIDPGICRERAARVKAETRAGLDAREHSRILSARSEGVSVTVAEGVNFSVALQLIRESS